jgi:hypothetical protein
MRNIRTPVQGILNNDFAQLRPRWMSDARRERSRTDGIMPYAHAGQALCPLPKLFPDTSYLDNFRRRATTIFALENSFFKSAEISKEFLKFVHFWEVENH